jgi:hypothetical protein
MKRRCIVIMHPDFDPDTPEAIETTVMICTGMKLAGIAVTEQAVQDLKRENPDFDDSDAMRIAQEVAQEFEYRVMKIEVPEK